MQCVLATFFFKLFCHRDIYFIVANWDIILIRGTTLI